MTSSSLRIQDYIIPQGKVPAWALTDDRPGAAYLLADLFLFTQSFNPQLQYIDPENLGAVLNLLALKVDEELHEFLRTMPETKLTRVVAGDGNKQEEAIDLLLFTSMLLIASGVSLEDLKVAFTRKVAVLAERFGL